MGCRELSIYDYFRFVEDDETADFAYVSDSITNILSGGKKKSDGSAEFAITPDIFNAINLRSIGSQLEVSGSAIEEATVSVNDMKTQRVGNYFFTALDAGNQTSANIINLEVVGTLFDPAETPEIGGDQPGNMPGSDVVATASSTVMVPKADDNMVYDSAGRLIENSLYRYGWDANDKLTAVESRIGTEAQRCKVENEYDYAGRRILKKVFEGSTLIRKHFYFYDQVLLNGQPADFGVLTGEKIVDGSGNPITDYQYLWGLDLDGRYQGLGGVGGLCAVIEWEATHVGEYHVYLPLMDAKGTIHGYIDENGTVVAKYVYDPYGRVVSYSGTKAKDFNLLYQSKYYDWETGLYNFGLRYYDPMTCRWLNRDPIGESGGVNLYAIANGDPINGIDLYGCSVYVVYRTLNHQIFKYGYFGGVDIGSGHVYLAFDAEGVNREAWEKLVNEIGGQPNIKPKRDINDFLVETFSFHPKEVQEEELGNHTHKESLAGILYTTGSYIGYNDMESDIRPFLKQKFSGTNVDVADAMRFKVDTNQEQQFALYRDAINARYVINEKNENLYGTYILGHNNCGTWALDHMLERHKIPIPHGIGEKNLFGTGIGGVNDYLPLSYMVTGGAIGYGYTSLGIQNTYDFIGDTLSYLDRKLITGPSLEDVLRPRNGVPPPLNIESYR